MFINGVKITITICVTIMVSCVLFISYSEYVNRYSLVSAPDNSIYIFDKKSHALNRCNDSGCQAIETKLPALSNLGITDQIVNTSSKMFGDSEKSMPEEIVKVEAKPASAEKAKGKAKTKTEEEENDDEEEEEEEEEKKTVFKPEEKQTEQVRQIKMKS
ncbi:MAG: hypothetical protein LBP31_01770 [Holosporales bacterium]|nr:hypothetical protein [Holosporales bacterium]